MVKSAIVAKQFSGCKRAPQCGAQQCANGCGPSWASSITDPKRDLGGAWGGERDLPGKSFDHRPGLYPTTAF